MKMIIEEIEINLRKDNEYINRRINDIFETSNDDKLILDMLDLAELVNKYVGIIIKKEERSAFEVDKLAEKVWPEMTLNDLIEGQKNKEKYLGFIK